MAEARRVAAAGLLILPGGLMLYFAFNSGGVYPGPPAYVAMVLCLVLALRAGIATAPFAGFSWPLAVAVGSLALYALLALVSGSWSHAPGVARIEFDLPLVYLVAMLLFGSTPRTRERLRWMLRALAVATTVVCTSALITRLLPHLWPISPEIANNRLSFPVTYWNVLGLVAALGIVLCAHLSSDLREPRATRVAAATVIPILASTLYFTFSRGAIAACVIAVVTYALLGRPRAMLSSLVAVGPATAIAIKIAYDANLLATLTPTTPAAIAQGHRVALGVLASSVGAGVLRAALAASLDERLRDIRLPAHMRRPVARAGWISTATAAVIAIVALHGTIASEYRGFSRPGGAGNGQDLRTRLTDPAGNGRAEAWKIAWRSFKSSPLLGKGAGTFQYTWARERRPYDLPVHDAHSLYMETLDELGIVGFVLLMTTILAVLLGVAARARGSGRPLYAAVFSVLLAWAIHAGVDWDWEMPVVSVVFFSLGGFALAHRRRRSRLDHPAVPRRLAGGAQPLLRVVVGAAFLLLAVAPAFVWLSQSKLDDAAYAFSERDCAAARSSALSSISILGNRAEPYEIVSYCDLRLGMPRAALAAINKAISLDPNNWNYQYDLALMRAAAGLDPRAAARKALSMNPYEPLVQDAWQTFSSSNRGQWVGEGKSIASGFTTL